MRIPRTFDFDQRVHEGDLLLSDEKLIAKLSEGDMHAIEAKYKKYHEMSFICNCSHF